MFIWIVQVFALHGIDISTKRCIALKSTAHFRAGYTLGPNGNTSKIITADAMGLTTKRPGIFEHHRCERPMWPADAEALPSFVVAVEDEEEVASVARL